MKNCCVLRMFHSCLFCCSKNDNQRKANQNLLCFCIGHQLLAKKRFVQTTSCNLATLTHICQQQEFQKQLQYYLVCFILACSAVPRMITNAEGANQTLPCSYCIGHPLWAKQFCNSCKLQIWRIHAIYNLQFGDPCTNQQEFPNQKLKIKTTRMIMFQMCMYCCSKSDHQCRRR